MFKSPFVKARNRTVLTRSFTALLALPFLFCGGGELTAQESTGQANTTAAPDSTQRPGPTLNDELIANLTRLKFPDDEIISKIQANDTDFVLDKENVEHLRMDGVSPKVLMAMFTAFNAKQQNEQNALVNEIYGKGTVKAPPPAAAMPAPGMACDDGKTALIYSSKSVDFGVQSLGTKSAVQQITVTNTSVNDCPVPPPTFITVHDDPSTPPFQILSSTSCRAKLAGKESCKIDLAFAPFSFAYSQNASTPQSVLPFNAYVSLGEPAPDIVKKEVAYKNASRELSRLRRDYLDSACRAVFDRYPGLNKPAAKQTSDHDHCVDLRDKIRKAGAAYTDSNADFLKAVRDSKDVITLSGTPKRWTYPITNFVVGLDASAASSQDVRQAYFVEADITAPLPFRISDGDPLDRRFWVFLNPRVTSLPVQSSTTAVSSLNVNADFLKGFPTTISGITQGFVFNAGLEFVCPYLCRKPREGASWITDFSGSTVRARFSDTLVLGFGASTPFSQDNGPPPAFQVNPSILDAFGCTTGAPSALTIKTLQGPTCANIMGSKDTDGNPVAAMHPNISFAYPDRSTFFPKFYMGLRLKTFFFNPDVHGDCNNSDGVGRPSASCEMPFNVFPGTVDLTAGKDAIITGGALSKWLFRVDVNHPLPFIPGMYIFGSTYMGLGKPMQTLPITLNSAANATDSNTERVILARPNRDVYRLGLGVDLLQILNKVGKPGANNAQPPPTTPAADKAAATKNM